MVMALWVTHSWGSLRNASSEVKARGPAGPHTHCLFIAVSLSCPWVTPQQAPHH